MKVATFCRLTGSFNDLRKLEAKHKENERIEYNKQCEKAYRIAHSEPVVLPDKTIQMAPLTRDTTKWGRSEHTYVREPMKDSTMYRDFNGTYHKATFVNRSDIPISKKAKAGFMPLVETIEGIKFIRNGTRLVPVCMA